MIDVPVGRVIFLEQNHLGQYEVSQFTGAERVPSRFMKWTEPEDAFAYADSLVPDDQIKLVKASAAWRKQPPTQPQCALLWDYDASIRRQFPGRDSFYHYASDRFLRTGNESLSRGSISARIDMAKYAEGRRKASLSHA